MTSDVKMDEMHRTEGIEDRLTDLWQENECLYMYVVLSSDREKKAIGLWRRHLSFTVRILNYTVAQT